MIISAFCMHRKCLVINLYNICNNYGFIDDLQHIKVTVLH